MSAQIESTGLPKRFQLRSRDSEGILQKLDLSGIDDWDSQIQQEAWDLIHEYAYIFSQNDLDLGKTSIVKHSIKVNDPTPFKECYQHIPPGMYNEVKTHIQGNVGCGCNLTF